VTHVYEPRTTYLTITSCGSNEKEIQIRDKDADSLPGNIEIEKQKVAVTYNFFTEISSETRSSPPFFAR
jgi:hypothetical protein